jgi:large subunit ribosomal protein L25
MKTVQIKGEARVNVGKKDAAAVRASGNVPSVLYGGEAPIHFSADKKAFNQIIYTPDAYLVDLDIAGTVYTAILKDSQFDVVSDEIIHADFLLAPAGKPVTVEIPVLTTGNAKGVEAGGKLQIILRKIKVKGAADKLPEAITVDMTDVELGGSVQVKAIPAIEGVEILNLPGAVVARVQVTRSSRMGDDEEGEAVAVAATEEAPAAE